MLLGMVVLMGFKVSRTLQKLDYFSGWNRKLGIPGMNFIFSFLYTKNLSDKKICYLIFPQVTYYSICLLFFVAELRPVFSLCLQYLTSLPLLNPLQADFHLHPSTKTVLITDNHDLHGCLQ